MTLKKKIFLAGSLLSLFAATSVLFLNATSTTAFPADGITFNQITEGAFPQRTCGLIVDSFENGFLSSGSLAQDKQIVRIKAIFPNRLEITVRDKTTNALSYHPMRFLQGQVSGAWNDLPDATLRSGDFRITSIANISTSANPNVGRFDGIEIRGQEFAPSGFPTGGVRIGYIFFSGDVKLELVGGVQANGRGTINSFYARTLSNRPNITGLFVGNTPSELNGYSFFEYGFKCFDLTPPEEIPSPETIAVVLQILQDE